MQFRGHFWMKNKDPWFSLFFSICYCCHLNFFKHHFSAYIPQKLSARKMLAKCVFHSFCSAASQRKKGTHADGKSVRLRWLALDKRAKRDRITIRKSAKTHSRPCGAVGGDFECVWRASAGSGRSGGRGALVARLVTTRGSARLHSERASERP